MGGDLKAPIYITISHRSCFIYPVFVCVKAGAQIYHGAHMEVEQ